jgi:hypothetical protein
MTSHGGEQARVISAGLERGIQLRSSMVIGSGVGHLDRAAGVRTNEEIVCITNHAAVELHYRHGDG